MLKKILCAMLALLTLLIPAVSFAVPTIAWMSDTQIYSSARSDIWPQMNQWILDNREELDIRYVFHTGDLVDASKSPEQWEYAEDAMQMLVDGEMPFLAVSGNHDVGGRPNYTRYLDNLGHMQPMHFAQEFADTGSRYELLTIGDRDYIFLGIAFSNKGPSDEECEWARNILNKYSDRTAIIVTHSYIKRGRELTTQGSKIYSSIIKPCPNVLLVLCGHCRGMSEKYQQLDMDGDGEKERTVYALLSNYQDDKQGGQGYMRFLMFRNNEICVYTYSPIIDSYDHGRDQTVHIIPLPPMEQTDG